MGYRSVFDDIDAQIESSMQNIKLKNEKVIYEGFLKTKTIDNQLQEEFFILTDDKLVI